MAERASEAAFDLVAHLVAHAPTLRDAIEICSQFERLLMDGAHLRLHEHGGVASIGLEFVRTSPRADRMLAEFALAALMRMLEAFGGRGTRPMRRALRASVASASSRVHACVLRA